jgi:phosphoglycerol transferase
MSGRLARSLAAYGAGAFVSSVAAAAFLQPWRADFRVPYAYGGDALGSALAVRSVADPAWYATYARGVALPGLAPRDYLAGGNDALHLALIKLASLFIHDWGALYNAYFLLGFPLIAVSAMAVLRRLGMSDGPSLVGGTLYSFLPVRLLDGRGDLFLASFFQVPLLALVLLWVAGDDPPWVPVRNRRLQGALAICALSGVTSFTYSVFAMVLLLVGGGWASLERRSARHALSGLVLATVIGATVVTARALETPHQTPAAVSGPRALQSIERHAMKIVDLLLPVDGHRWRGLGKLKRRYDAEQPISAPETSSTSLGVVGTIGFLALLGVLVGGPQPDRPPDRLYAPVLRPLSVLNAAALLVATLGGFGAVLSVAVGPVVGDYSRMSVVIGFFALVPIVGALDRLGRANPSWGNVALCAVLILGLLDQVPIGALWPQRTSRRAYASDAALVAHVESTLPAGSTVFEFPYAPPALPSRLETYDPVRPYLHSRSLRWSYPALERRGGDTWAADAPLRDYRSTLDALTRAGATGVVVDRYAYPDSGATVQAVLGMLTHAAPWISDGERFAFFELSRYDVDAERAKAGSTAEEDLAMQFALHPVAVDWIDGCYDPEPAGDRIGTFRWCRAAGSVRVKNDLPVTRRLSVSARLFPAFEPAHLTLDGDAVHLEVTLPARGIVVARDVDVGPGSHDIRFRCDGRPADAPNDPRTLVWNIHDFTIDEQGSRASP